MSYTGIFKESLRLFWNHKALWLFGIILALIGEGEYGFNVSYREGISNLPSENGSVQLPGFLDNSVVRNFFENPIPYIVGFGALALVWWIVANFISAFAHGALIGMVDEIEHTGVTSFNRGWGVGQGKVKTLFVLAIIFAIPQLIVLLSVLAGGFPIFAQLFDLFRVGFTDNFPASEQPGESLFTNFSSVLSAFACLLPLVCIAGIVGWALGLLYQIAARSCVLEDLGVVASIRRGWHIARRNLGYTVLNWFVLLVLSSIFGFGAAIPALVLWVPTARAFLHNEWSSIAMVTGVLTGFYLFIVIVGLGGILTSFNSILWTKLYKNFVLDEEGSLGLRGAIADPSNRP